MASQQIVGRQRELARIAELKAAKKPAFVAVYGRRRIGKTFLIRHAFSDQLALELVGMKDGLLSEQLHNFTLALTKASQGKFPAEETPKSWRAAFEQLRNWCETLPKNKQYVLFFDELPWLASNRSRFLESLDYFWNSYGSQQDNMILIVCGSAASWMINKLLKNKGGLYNRVTHRIRLLPFDLAETKQFLESRRVRLSDYQIIELTMAMGGVPLYLEQAKPGESSAQIIDRTCFAQDGLLRDEFNQLYAALFDKSERHVSIVRALATKLRGLTRGEIASLTEQSPSGRLTSIIEELVESGFVQGTVPYGKSTKDTLYRLTDEYSLFYLQWIERKRRESAGGWQTLRGTPKWRAWSGAAFESVCMKHIGQIKHALGIAGVATTAASWRYRGNRDLQDEGTQVDLLIDRADACINLCEMKFSESEFTIDKHYAKLLQARRETFRRVTKTKKAVFITFVTTNGIRDNPYALEVVDSSLTMKALFEPN
ncbi:MAG: AAA family ATPase [Planctomycetaceae bacterium]|nr:AAA family ATPase [Planctomycetaceae bacterium]